MRSQLYFTGEYSPMQKLMLSMMGSFAELEHSMIKERQAEGIAKAKAKGVYKGHVKRVDDDAIRTEIAAGLSFRKTAEKLGLSLHDCSTCNACVRPPISPATGLSFLRTASYHLSSNGLQTPLRGC